MRRGSDEEKAEILGKVENPGAVHAVCRRRLRAVRRLFDGIQQPL